MADHVLAIGAGHAAGQLVASLLSAGHPAEAITLVGEEPHVPYQRPPLSKAFLAGEIGLEKVYLKPLTFYEEAGVRLHLGVRAEALDAAGRTLRLASGERLGYDRAVLATGSKVRRLPVDGADLGGVHYLRTIADVEAIRPAFEPGRRLVVVGGGYIGLEVAAVAAKRGLKVTVIEAMDRVLARVTAPILSHFFEEEHRRKGVDLRLGSGVTAFEGTAGLEGVRLADGTRIAADLAVIGIGIEPCDELAMSAGLACDNGILVDELTRTSEESVLAIGDCTNHPNTLYGRRLRLESVQNALDQAKTAAALLSGQEKPYNEVPWFWSDQYDLKLQIAGLTEGYDDVVVRGDPGARAFAAFYFAGERLIAVEAVNAAPEYMVGRRLIASRASPDRTRLADPAVPIKEFM